VLRIASPVEPSRRLSEITRQLGGIGGGRSLGFGPNRVRSLPDGVAQVLEEYLQERQERLAQSDADDPHQAPLPLIQAAAVTPPLAAVSLPRIGDLCPECGQAAVVNEEGCRKCYACGYSEC